MHLFTNFKAPFHPLPRCSFPSTSQFKLFSHNRLHVSDLLPLPLPAIMLPPEALAPHPSAVPSPGGPLRVWLGGPSPTPTPPLQGQKSEVNLDSMWETCCTVCCAGAGREERKDFRLPHFLPGSFSYWLMGLLGSVGQRNTGVVLVSVTVLIY